MNSQINNKMKVQYRIPASVTGSKEVNLVADAKNLFQIFKLWRKARKEKATAFFIFF